MGFSFTNCFSEKPTYLQMNQVSLRNRNNYLLRRWLCIFHSYFELKVEQQPLTFKKGAHFITSIKPTSNKASFLLTLGHGSTYQSLEEENEFKFSYLHVFVMYALDCIRTLHELRLKIVGYLGIDVTFQLSICVQIKIFCRYTHLSALSDNMGFLS